MDLLETLAGHHGRATSEIAVALGLSPRAMRTRLAGLVARGLVREIGTGPQDPERRYHLATCANPFDASGNLQAHPGAQW